MLKKYERVSYELLRPDQVRNIRERVPIAYIPAGSVEWHSFQNPLGCDSLKAHAVCCEAALLRGGVVLPPLYQGLLGMGNWGPKDWEDYTLGFNREAVFRQLALGVCRALVEAEWKVLVGVTGHDVPEQRAALAWAIRRATRARKADGFALMEGDLHRPGRRLPYSMDHAGAWETSCMLYACPGKVSLSALRSRGLARRDNLDMRGPEGIGGRNPVRYASKALGRRIVQEMARLIARKARSCLKRA